MNALNLVIDFNNMVMRALHTCQTTDDVKIKNFDKQEECDAFMRKTVTDICFVLRAFNPDRVIFACDAKFPWRTDLYKNLDINYKGNREKDLEKNWTNIFKVMDDLKGILANKGFVVTDLENTEADDLAALWKDVILNKQQDNMIYVSSDKDWSQLVCLDDNKHYCIGYNPVINNRGTRKMFVDEKTHKWLNSTDDVDFFMNGFNKAKSKLCDIVRTNNKISVEVIDPQRVLLDKVMCGDDGDNVPAFYEYYKGGRKTRVTPTKAATLFETLNIHSIDDLVSVDADFTLKEALESVMKTTIDIDFGSRLLRQRRMVELKSDLFPKRIVDNFYKHAESVANVGFGNFAEIKMDTILKGTSYEYKGSKNRYNSIFADIDLTKYNKTPALF